MRDVKNMSYAKGTLNVLSGQRYQTSSFYVTDPVPVFFFPAYSAKSILELLQHELIPFKICMRFSLPKRYVSGHRSTAPVTLLSTQHLARDLTPEFDIAVRCRIVGRAVIWMKR